MKIHIVDTDTHPLVDTKVSANCGEVVRFIPMKVEWGDGRICPECFRIHKNSQHTTFTFAVPDR